MATTATTLALPTLGRGNYNAGKREALRAFYEHYFTLEGDALELLAVVEAGGAPEEFKAGFRETLDALATAVTPDGE